MVGAWIFGFGGMWDLQKEMDEMSIFTYYNNKILQYW